MYGFRKKIEHELQNLGKEAGETFNFISYSVFIFFLM